MPVVSSQIELPMHRHGGKRAGAGRPRTSRAMPHARRTAFLGKATPLHVTLRMTRGVWNLRSERAFRCIQHALAAESARGALRIVHYSVQGNHLHLIVETDDGVTLSRRMQGFSIRLARRLNAMMGRRGRVIGDRFHARALEGPRQVNIAIRYVLQNHAIHRAREGAIGVARDRFSSVVTRRADLLPAGTTGPPLLVAEPESWVLNVGWVRGATSPRAR